MGGSVDGIIATADVDFVLTPEDQLAHFSSAQLASLTEKIKGYKKAVDDKINNRTTALNLVNKAKEIHKKVAAEKNNQPQTQKPLKVTNPPSKSAAVPSPLKPMATTTPAVKPGDVTPPLSPVGPPSRTASPLHPNKVMATATAPAVPPKHKTYAEAMQYNASVGRTPPPMMLDGKPITFTYYEVKKLDLSFPAPHKNNACGMDFGKKRVLARNLEEGVRFVQNRQKSGPLTGKVDGRDQIIDVPEVLAITDPQTFHLLMSDKIRVF